MFRVTAQTSIPPKLRPRDSTVEWSEKRVSDAETFQGEWDGLSSGPSGAQLMLQKLNYICPNKV
jgi:hypothetical protein